MRLVAEPLRQCRDNPRLADPGFAGNQNDLAVASPGARPAVQQQADFIVAPDQWAQRRSTQGLEPAGDSARPQRQPGRHRPDDALEFDLAEIAVFEQVAGQAAGAGRKHDSVGLGQGLQARGDIGRVAGDIVLGNLAPTTTSPVAIPTRAWSSSA